MLQCLMFRTVLVLAGLLAADAAAAADVCPLVRNRQSAPDVATRIAAVACSEHMLWYRPFIDAQGRLASASVAEAENTGLDDGGTPAWLRVTPVGTSPVAGLIARDTTWPAPHPTAPPPLGPEATPVVGSSTRW